MKKIAIGILNQNRYHLLDRTLKSLLDTIGHLSSQYDVFIWDNGSDEEVVERIKGEWGWLFKEMLLQDHNRGIGAGMKGLHEATREYEYYLHLENDWECVAPDQSWFESCVEILDSFKEIGIIKLRAFGDGQYEMVGENLRTCAAFYSPWWLTPIPSYVESEITSWGHYAYHAKIQRGYTNNPHMLRKSMVKDWHWDDSVEGYGLEEEKTEVLPALCGFETAQLHEGFFKHIG